MNGFAANRYVLRARRLADLSQRDLAAALGVSPATVARLESSDTGVPAAMLDRVLRLAGLRLAVVDADGREVVPFPTDTLRDNAGRRFPAHLDVDPPDEVPPLRRHMPRYDRPAARGWYRLRPERDRRRADEGTATDHTTEHDVRERARRWKLAQARTRAILRSRSAPILECQCNTGCWIGLACEPSCPCQCEPASRRRDGSAGDPP